jgi:argininosuccinate lyase
VGEKGMPFRTAYKITGEIVAYCIKNHKTLESMTLEEYKGFSENFDEGIYHAVDLMTCLEKRTSYGGTSVSSVGAQIENAKKRL